MINNLLIQNEGKTIEFKESCRSIPNIVQTVVAFANTAGGNIVIGVKDKTKEIVGIDEPLKEEERISNAIADTVQPLIMPDFQIHSWRDRELLVIYVPHLVGPYYIKAKGPEKGVYIRLGSTNRQAGPAMVSELRRRARNITFDEQSFPEINSEDIDFRVASELFQKVSKPLTLSKRKSLGLMVDHGRKMVPSIGAFLLFGIERERYFPDSFIRCARFAGKDTAKFVDQTEINVHLPYAVEQTIAFIERHTNQGIEIGRVYRKTFPNYPPEAVREAIINAIVHADYSLPGSDIKVAVFSDRIEITNPGLLPFGMTMQAALSGVSILRNRVVGRIFRELDMIEQWGSGIGRIFSSCREYGLQTPIFNEVGTSFRVTLFGTKALKESKQQWQLHLIDFLKREGEISTKQSAQLWKVSDRAARTRLRKMVETGVLAELATGPRDPYKKYILRNES